MQTLPAFKLKKMASDIKGEIKALGNVNVNAIEEYKAVAERYETMKTQHDDMVEAEGKLASIIEDLNISMQKQFQEKFMQIRKEFDRIFKLLFGGGKGTLELADPENLLETGVIITAQPAGEKITEYDAVIRWRESVDGDRTAICYSEFETITLLPVG